jgi:hypothetical protein
MQCSTAQKTQKKLQILKERIRRYPLTSVRFSSNTTIGGLTPHSTDLTPFNVNLSRKWRNIGEDIISCQDDEVKDNGEDVVPSTRRYVLSCRTHELPKCWQSVWTTGVYVKQELYTITQQSSRKVIVFV